MTLNQKFWTVTVAIVGASVVAATGNDGWGWLIFIAILGLLHT